MPAKVFFLHREKILLDTSVYISHLRKGLYRDELDSVIRASILHFHSVVYEELVAGCRGKHEMVELERYQTSFLKSDRIVTPTHEEWEETGLVVKALIHKGWASKGAVGLTHDILIALSARRRGIRVITENRRDFEAIRSLKDFKLTVWS